MSKYFAEIKNGIVKRVIVADQNFIDSGVVGDSKNWVETKTDGTEKYAAIGDERHEDIEAFVSPKPFESWILDKSKKEYIAPVEKPIEKSGIFHEWDERSLCWKEVALPILQEEIITK